MDIRLFLLSVAALSLVSGPDEISPTKSQATLTAQPYRASDIYRSGETVGWTIFGPPGKATYTVKKNNQVPCASGELDLSSGTAHLEVQASEPEMVYVQIRPTEGRALSLGAAVEPRKLRPVRPRPRDFDSFWKRKLAELRAIPENPILTPALSGRTDVDYSTIRMDHVNGTHVYGQMAKPAKPGKYPAMLILQWASPPYRLWSPWVVDRAAEGWLALNIEPHDVLPTEPQSYYNGLPAALKSYNVIGMGDRETSYFVEMYLRGVRAVDYLSQRPDWDGKTLVVIGTSMGGQQSLAVAALNPRVTHMIIEEPSGCDMNPPEFGRQMGYPSFPANDPKVMEASRYVDGVNFAPLIRARSLVAMGFLDTVAPPTGIWTAFNIIRGKKEVAPMPLAPHNNTATAEQQRPYTMRASEWLSALARSEPIPPPASK